MRAQSLYSLGELRDATSAPTVLAGTADPSGLVRHAAVCAACRLGAPSAVPYVTRALQRDDNERVRAAAAGALYLLQTADSLRALLDALLASADSEIVTRGAVAQHVERRLDGVTARWPTGAHSPSSVQATYSLSKGSNWRQRYGRSPIQTRRSCGMQHPGGVSGAMVRWQRAGASAAPAYGQADSQATARASCGVRGARPRLLAARRRTGVR